MAAANVESLSGVRVLAFANPEHFDILVVRMDLPVGLRVKCESMISVENERSESNPEFRPALHVSAAM